MATFNREYEGVEIPSHLNADDLARFYCRFVKLCNKQQDKDEDFIINLYDDPEDMLDDAFDRFNQKI